MTGPVVHSTLSFSGRERWRACPVSVHLSAGMPDSSSVAADEGTAAHAIGEHYVRWACAMDGAVQDHPADITPPAGLEVKDVVEWNAEIRKHGVAYANYVRSLREPDGHVTLEQKVAIPSISEHLFGTGDCFVWNPTSRTLHVPDYKYGFKFVEVGTVDDPNPQLAAYAVAACETFKLMPRRIVLHIVQPRVGAPRSLVIDDAATWLSRERDKLCAEVAGVANPGAPRPGGHCRYCKAKSKCGVTANAVAVALEVNANIVDLRTISDDEALNLYASRTAFKAFLDDIEERVKGIAKIGHARVSIKESKGRQMWADPKDAALTFLALGLTDLLQPVAISDAAPKLSDEMKKMLITHGNPARSIKISDVPNERVLAAVFRKYADGQSQDAAQIEPGAAGDGPGVAT